MSAFKSDFLRVMSERGFIHQISDETGLDQLFAKEKVTAYVGYDATATSLHIGNLISATMLYWMQETGHRPIALMGGGTSMIGDPSFRDDQRSLLTPEAIATNIEGIKRIFGRILRFGDTGNDAIMVNNADWLMKLNYVEFLRDVGRHFSVNRMLTFDSVRLRLEREQSLSFLEFNYMILQGYDFVELSRRLDCRLQMGGSDQWGNIINGVDLGHRMGTPQLYALTTPLLTTSSGAKMGKSAKGAVWLNGDLYSPYDFWQYWRNTEDADVERFLKIFTRLPLSEIARLAALGGSEINEAKKVLATETTAIVHGREAAQQAEETARKTFEEGATTASLPTLAMPKEGWMEARSAKVIAFASGLFTSKSEVRRKMDQGGVRINDERVSDPDKLFFYNAMDPNIGAFKVQFGKRIVLVRPE